jgi:hypothetical protein
MSTDLIQEKFTNHFTKKEYQFLTPKLEPGDLKWPRSDQIKEITYHENTSFPEIRGMGRMFGLAAAPTSPNTILEKFLKTLREIQKHGEIVGFSLEGGAPKILLAMDSEKLTDEQILGRFILIRDTAQKFRDFASKPLMGPRWSKHPTNCHVFMVFSSHAKALNFSENLEGKCKHFNVFTNAPHVSWRHPGGKAVPAHKPSPEWLRPESRA